MNKDRIFAGVATLTLVAASSVMILTSCGEQYCGIGLIGDCDKMYKDAGQQQSGSPGGGGALTVKAATDADKTIYKNQQAQLTANGGRVPISQTKTEPPNCGTVDTAKTWKFTPTTPPFGDCTIYFRDADNPVHEAQVTITVNNF